MGKYVRGREATGQVKKGSEGVDEDDTKRTKARKREREKEIERTRVR